MSTLVRSLLGLTVGATLAAAGCAATPALPRPRERPRPPSEVDRLVEQGPLIVIVSLAVEDVPRSVELYREALGWSVREWAATHVTLVIPGDHDRTLLLQSRVAFEAAYGRLVERAPAREPTGTELYLRVAHAERAARRVMDAGGVWVSPLGPRPGGDVAAYLADPDGNVIAVGERTTTGTPSGFFARNSRVDGPPTLLRTTIATSDPSRAAAFYRSGFGWTLRSDSADRVELEMPGGTFFALSRVAQADSDRLSGALLYVRCKDAAAVVSRLVAAGARVLSGLTRRSWGHDVAYLVDLDGTVLGIAEVSRR